MATKRRLWVLAAVLALGLAGAAGAYVALTGAEAELLWRCPSGGCR